MNIDIVNRVVSKKLGIHESKVSQINSFYWTQIRNTLYDFVEQPVSIEGICVLYTNKYILKKGLYEYILRMRALRGSKKFTPYSVKYNSYMEKYQTIFRHLWRLRKHYKFTN